MVAWENEDNYMPGLHKDYFALRINFLLETELLENTKFSLKLVF